MARESELWRWMKFKGPQNPDIHVERREDLLTKAAPDIEGCISGAAFQIETKVLHGMTKFGAPVGTLKFEPGQREWGRRRWAAGGMSYCLIGVPSQGSAYTNALCFVPGLFLPSLPEAGRVTVERLRSMCLLSLLTKSTGPVLKDGETLGLMWGLLAAPIGCRKAVAALGQRNPDFLASIDAGVDGILDDLQKQEQAESGLPGF